MAAQPHDALIDAIGAKVVADAYKLSRQRLHHWRTRGVPHSYRVAFAKLAAEKGVAVPPDFFKGMVA
jgi:hypothetical protein